MSELKWKDPIDGQEYELFVVGEQEWIPLYMPNKVKYFSNLEVNTIVPDGWQLPTKEDWIKLTIKLGGIKEVFRLFPFEWLGCIAPNGDLINPNGELALKRTYFITGEDPVIMDSQREYVEYETTAFPNYGIVNGEKYNHKEHRDDYKGVVALVRYKSLEEETDSSSAEQPIPEPQEVSTRSIPVGIEILSENVFMDYRDNNLYTFTNVDGLNVMTQNLKYNINGLYPYDPTGCFYTSDEILSLPVDTWRIPSHKDIMHLLNNADIEDIRGWLHTVLNINYNGYVVTGTPLRREWVNIMSALWIQWHEYKKAFTLRTMKFNPRNKESAYIEAELETDHDVLASYGIYMNKPYTTLANARLVQGDVSLSTITLLHGWNYINFGKLGIITSPVALNTLFGDNLKHIIQIKTLDDSPFKLYWNMGESTIGDLSEIESDRFYAIYSNKTFRL